MPDQLEQEFLNALNGSKRKAPSYTTTLKGDVVKLLEEWEKKGLKDKKAALVFLIQLGHKAATELAKKNPTHSQSEV